MGGKFGDGFLSGAFVSPGGGGGFEWGNFAAAMVAGGVGSVLGGGKFKNGAVTAAFGYLISPHPMDSSSESDIDERLAKLTPEQKAANLEQNLKVFKHSLAVIDEVTDLDVFSEVSVVPRSKIDGSLARTTCAVVYCSDTVKVSAEYLQAGYSSRHYAATAYHEVLHYNDGWKLSFYFGDNYERRHAEIIQKDTLFMLGGLPGSIERKIVRSLGY